MYRIELINDKEELINSEDYKNKIDMMISYNKIKKHVNIRYKLHGLTMQVFEGQHAENLREITKYRVEF